MGEGDQIQCIYNVPENTLQYLGIVLENEIKLYSTKFVVVLPREKKTVGGRCGGKEKSWLVAKNQ